MKWMLTQHGQTDIDAVISIPLDSPDVDETCASNYLGRMVKFKIFSY